VRLDGTAWRTFFDGFQREAFRLETLQVYDMASEQAEYDHFLVTGELHIPDDDQWLARVRHFRSTGRWVGRVHVVTRPLTDYLRYEFAVYRHTVRAGEDVRVRWCLSPSAAIVTQLVTRSPVSTSSAAHGSGDSWSPCSLAVPTTPQVGA